MKAFLSNKTKASLKKIGWITLSWLLISCGIVLYETLVLTSPDVAYTGISIRERFYAQMLATVMAGLTGGALIVVYFQNWLRSMPYGKALLLILGAYSIICILVTYAAGLFTYSRSGEQSNTFSEIHNLALAFLTGAEFLRIYLSWLLILLVTLIALMVRDKYGPGIFGDFLLGKYFQPRREERIFMFLDLRSSTTIAEQLGEERYFNFIKELFADATGPIILSKGEIYQYVGDEIVVSWKMKNGISDANCINCFFDIQKMFLNKKQQYLQAYGVAPEFKAGLHYGHVMAGEVGVVKRDVAFSGDVLNTTARIQSLCNEIGVDLLFSKYLSDKLRLNNDTFTSKRMGVFPLRGKHDKVELYSA